MIPSRRPVAKPLQAWPARPPRQRLCYSVHPSGFKVRLWFLCPDMLYWCQWSER